MLLKVAILCFLANSLANRRTFQTTCVATNRCLYLAVSDQDTSSKITHESGNYVFESHMVLGELSHDQLTQQFSLTQFAPRAFYSNYNELGRGMELSELIIWRNKLLTFDDRTGICYEIHVKRNDSVHSVCDACESMRLAEFYAAEPGAEDFSFVAVPRVLITQNVHTPKGFKIEWAALKHDQLYVGSFGKEVVNEATDTIEHYDNNNVVIFNSLSDFRRVNWSHMYEALRKATGTSFPGYMIHEAVLYREVSDEWVFLPRRVSKTPYNSVADERRGSNLVLFVDSALKVRTVRIKFSSSSPYRGFSSATFLPGSNEELIAATRTVEIDSQGVLQSYLSVFSIYGDLLMDEVLISDTLKLEGIELIQSKAAPSQT